jgi:regulator of protease activity HflC (stomatin/prohibitin superfamily)
MPVNEVLEYLWFRDNDPWWATLLRAVVLIALAVLFAFKGMHKVPSGSKALRTRFNKVIHYRRDLYDRSGYAIHRRGEAKVIDPGLVIGIPFVHNVMIESISEQFEPLPPIVRQQPWREVVSEINFKVVDLEKALVDFTDYRGSLVKSCAAAVRRLVERTNLNDDDISARLLDDESPLQQRAHQLGVKLLELNVSTTNPTAPAQAAHPRLHRMQSSVTSPRSGPKSRRTPTMHPAPIVNDAAGQATLTLVDDNAPAA